VVILALESATDQAAVAVADESGVLASAVVARGRRHGESIAPAVQFVCARAGVSLSAVDAVAVDVGPGLFTGLRVGVATAKGIAFALGVPVVALTSLEVLAHGATGMVAPGPDDLVVPVVDARRGQLFWAPFAAAPEVVRTGDERLSDPAELADELGRLAKSIGDAGRCLCLGDGARRYADVLGALPGVAVAGPRWAHPDVAVLAELGQTRLARGHGVPAEAVAAHYLREADVRINWERRTAARVADG